MSDYQEQVRLLQKRFALMGTNHKGRLPEGEPRVERQGPSEQSILPGDEQCGRDLVKLIKHGQGDSRRCLCGCGRVLPARYPGRYAPECPIRGSAVW